MEPAPQSDRDRFCQQEVPSHADPVRRGKCHPLVPEHFLARKATDLASVKNLARENPAALVRNILESLDGKATTQQISEWLFGDVFTEAEWKRWWESTKKALKASGI